MDLKERLTRGLQHAQWFTDKVLSDITPGPDWLRRPVPEANHAMWIVGHLAVATNAFIGFVDPSKKDLPEEYGRLFGKGSQPTDSLDDYPAPEEVLAKQQERNKTFADLLQQCSPEDLEREVPEGPGFMFDVAAVFHMGAWHEALHGGQLTIIHRMLGNNPIAG